MFVLTQLDLIMVSLGVHANTLNATHTVHEMFYSSMYKHGQVQRINTSMHVYGGTARITVC